MVLCFSSLYWISGVDALIKGTLYGTTRIITTDIFSPEFEFHLIEQYKVTIALNLPHQIILMMKSNNFSKTNLSSLKFLISGGSKLPFHIKSELNSLLPHGIVVIGYGMILNETCYYYLELYYITK